MRFALPQSISHFRQANEEPPAGLGTFPLACRHFHASLSIDTLTLTLQLPYIQVPYLVRSGGKRRNKKKKKRLKMGGRYASELT
jgi:hypothetical protein